MEINLTLDTPSDLEIGHGRYGNRLSFKADSAHILDHFTPTEVLAHFGTQAMLDEIGENAAREFWGLMPCN
jgi:hypothetical protein